VRQFVVDGVFMAADLRNSPTANRGRVAVYPLVLNLSRAIDKMQEMMLQETRIANEACQKKGDSPAACSQSF